MCDAEIVIDAPAEAIWAVVADVTRVGEWSAECRSQPGSGILIDLHSPSATAPDVMALGSGVRRHYIEHRGRLWRGWWLRVAGNVAYNAVIQVTGTWLHMTCGTVVGEQRAACQAAATRHVRGG
jgi:hypothetical protein